MASILLRVQDVCSVESNPPGRRVVRSDLGGIIFGMKVGVYWRWPEATGNLQGEWHEATVKSSNRRGLGTMTVEYDEDHIPDTVNIEEENVVWMDPVGNIDAEEDLRLNIEEPVVPTRGYVRRPTPKCPHGK